MRGFIYQCSSRNYLEPLRRSIQSLRRYHIEPITVYSTFNVGIQDVTVRQMPLVTYGHLRGSMHHWINKFNTYLASPYYQTIYFDADTVIVKSVDDLFGDDLAMPVIPADGRLAPCMVSYGVDRSLILEAFEYAKSHNAHDQNAFRRIDEGRIKRFPSTVYHDPKWCKKRQVNRHPNNRFIHLSNRQWKKWTYT